MRRILLLLLLLVTACSIPATQKPITPAVGTLAPAQRVTEIPTVTNAPTPLPEREKYTLNTTIDYDRHIVSMDETIAYPNHTGQSLDKLVLAVAPNLWPNCFSLISLSINDTPVTNYTLKAHRLGIPLPTPLAPDSVATVTLGYKLSLPFLDQAHSLRARIFGYSDIQMNLVNWYPFIVPFIDGEWAIREPWSHGEYLVYPFADFEVNLKFTNPENVPVVAASGFAEPNGEFTRYTLTEGRAFAISASRDFQVSTMQVGDTMVYSYYLPIYQRAGLAAMNASAQAVQVFSQRFGLYPHKTLSIVMADFKDSMEFSALYFHSRSFYDLYNGTPEDYLTFVAVHETGHQWWFDQVANDQALEPWLDESLSTYSESLYYEALLPDLLPLWWSKRIDFFEPGGVINIPVYDGQNDDNYKRTVYFNGAHFLQDLRQRIGDDSFHAFLRDYYDQSRGRIVSANDFFRILDENTDVDYSDIVRGYFRNR
ncbi:MAG TPA: M1 family metallopeptidase [Anaerolineales bacterium]|nr:M1 family metallopeptidase [Anaerolineales bacterium]